MKKLTQIFAAGFGALLLALAFCVPAFAESQLSYVTDAASLLTDAERSTLEQQAESISNQYQCGVYLITLDDFTAYVATDDVVEAAKSLYREYDLGTGGDGSGILLLLSTDERDYALVAFGYGNTAFTDYGKDVLSDRFLDNFGDDDWNGGFTDYLAGCGTMLESARAGQPVDVQGNGEDAQSDPMVTVVGLAISFLLGCAVAGIICFILRQTMHSVAKGADADAYIPAEGVAITGRNDIFTHATEVRTKIEKPSSGGGLGGTTVGSDGFSSKSGKF